MSMRRVIIIEDDFSYVIENILFVFLNKRRSYKIVTSWILDWELVLYYRACKADEWAWSISRVPDSRRKWVMADVVGRSVCLAENWNKRCPKCDYSTLTTSWLAASVAEAFSRNGRKKKEDGIDRLDCFADVRNWIFRLSKVR